MESIRYSKYAIKDNYLFLFDKEYNNVYKIKIFDVINNQIIFDNKFWQLENPRNNFRDKIEFTIGKHRYIISIYKYVNNQIIISKNFNDLIMKINSKNIMTHQNDNIYSGHYILNTGELSNTQYFQLCYNQNELKTIIPDNLYLYKNNSNNKIPIQTTVPIFDIYSFIPVIMNNNNEVIGINYDIFKIQNVKLTLNIKYNLNADFIYACTVIIYPIIRILYNNIETVINGSDKNQCSNCMKEIKITDSNGDYPLRGTVNPIIIDFPEEYKGAIRVSLSGMWIPINNSTPGGGLECPFSGYCCDRTVQGIYDTDNVNCISTKYTYNMNMEYDISLR